MHPTWAALAIGLLIPYATAFYPYAEPGSEPPSHRRGIISVPKGDIVNLRIPIHRVVSPRANQYNIISAAEPSTKNSIGIDQDGTDFSYMAKFQFGSSPDVYHLLVDSGASNTWVMSAACTNQACNSHNTYGPQKSSSLTVTTGGFEIKYGTGTVSGVLVSDTAKFAGFSVPLTFGLAEEVSKEFFSYPMDGILGLGRADTSSDPGTINAPTVMDVLATQKLIPAKMYGVTLWRAVDGGTNDGVLNFGAPDRSRYSGDLTYASAITNRHGFWEVAVDDIAVDGKTAGLTGRSVILDTGTSFILLPEPDAVKFHSLISGSSQNGENFLIPCSSRQIVQLQIDGKNFGISPKDYVGRPSGANDGKCFSYIIGRQTFDEGQWLVGDVFFKNVYALFDFDGKRVGLGTKGPSSSSSLPPSSATTLSPTASLATSSPTAASMITLSDSISPPLSARATWQASTTASTLPAPLLPGSAHVSGAEFDPSSNPEDASPTASEGGASGAGIQRNQNGQWAMFLALVIAVVVR
ncbi:acid protease [Eremomyces bilateralis CBS 781.70]|uniref:Acid protease n=1 Tax=Eremomyces bilateralis CBS 781.70 TaxID=1392243 RepID=A0A6G1G8V6_9PEZI|nr:acid protease [Eremomyces bilateralis CBS 781.70]KAF1814508.1 acid protease [Eremomyces bilateralis CBS 781.70]